MAQNNNFQVETNDNTIQNTELTTKVPSKILHFSDGVLEYYDEDEDENQNPTDDKIVNAIDTSKLTWGPWFTHKVVNTGQTVLNACDYAGETLAYYLGITTPKYQFEIEEYERIKQREKEDAEMAKGWINNPSTDTTTQQPHQPNEAVIV